MNPTQTAPKPNVMSPESMLEKAFENPDFLQPPPLEEADLIAHTDQAKADIKNSWAEFYALSTEDIKPATPESPVNKIEVTETKVEYQFTEKAQTYEKQDSKVDTKPIYVVEEQKGSGSWLEDAGFKLDFKSLFSSIFGLFGGIMKDTFKTLILVKEMAMDTTTLIVGKKEKRAEAPPKTEAEAKKKEEQKRKNANIRAFYEGLKAQIGSVASKEAVQAETQERENINKTLKLTNVAYKGVKDSFGRLTVYAASMFEREQIDEEKRMKKMEKEQKMASATGKGPDLNMDKVAEGGFLSSTGGQGAG